MGTIDRLFGQRETSAEKEVGKAAERGHSRALGKFAGVLGGLTFVLLLTSIPPAGAQNLSWTTRASMPTARGGLGVAAANNGKVYAIGGYNGVVNVASVEEYDPATDTWATRASMPTARAGLALVAASNGKLYAIGGGFPPLSTVEQYDPATDTWATRASMPTARYILAAAAASNGKVYAVGGINGLTSPPPTTGLLEQYDPATDTWATRTSMPTARYCLGFAAASDGRLYAVGGVVPVNVFSATVEQYDPATDTWTAQTSMAFARHVLGAAAASNGKLYAIGGQNGSTYLATNEEATIGTVPFSAFSAKVEIVPGPPSSFEVNATFTLGAGSDGIKPLTEALTLQVGTFSTTIPAGSFKQDEEGRFKFEGTIGSVALEVEIVPLGGNQFQFKAEGQGANLTGTVNPVTVQLTIGDDGGSTTVTAEFN